MEPQTNPDISLEGWTLKVTIKRFLIKALRKHIEGKLLICNGAEFTEITAPQLCKIQKLNCNLSNAEHWSQTTHLSFQIGSYEAKILWVLYKPGRKEAWELIKQAKIITDYFKIRVGNVPSCSHLALSNNKLPANVSRDWV